MTLTTKNDTLFFLRQVRMKRYAYCNGEINLAGIRAILLMHSVDIPLQEKEREGRCDAYIFGGNNVIDFIGYILSNVIKHKMCLF